MLSIHLILIRDTQSLNQLMYRTLIKFDLLPINLLEEINNKLLLLLTCVDKMCELRYQSMVDSNFSNCYGQEKSWCVHLMCVLKISGSATNLP